MPDRIVLLSADGHAGPPVADYAPYVDPDFRDDFERFVPAREAWRRERNRSMGLSEDGELVHALFGEEMVEAYLGLEAIAAGGAIGVHDSNRRNQELEVEGIVGEVLFPDFQNSNEPPWGAAFPFPDTTPELRGAGARAFNRWLADFCALLPGRRAGVAIVQPHDLDAAVREVHWVRDHGLASVMLPTGDLGLPSYSDPFYDPLWAACVDTGLPVTIHSGGTPWEGYGSEAMWVTKVEFLWWSRRPLWQLIFGGVFERFPELRVAFTEQGIDWIPSMLDRFEEQYQSPFERGITDKLKLSPRGYWARNCYAGASFMSRGEADIRDQIGVDRIMWGADFPHIEGTWPITKPALRDAFAGCTPEEFALMTSTVAADVYGFDLAVLQREADRVGPTLDEVLAPAEPAPATYSETDYALGKVSGLETGRRLGGLMLAAFSDG
ncbi:MAG: putative TIM-barrel fold metal-dependent hydrolase [Actinomycetia bacterium]|nr:putative TIM-barrel fold metal-dependent hydrolase [Actinomycetes bacterium]